MDSTTIAIITTALWGVSEALSLIPSVKANGVFQLIYGVIKKITGRG